MSEIGFESERRIVVLQAAEHAVHYSKYERSPTDLVIPIGVDALYYANKNNWEVCNLKDLFSHDDYKVAANQSQTTIDELISQLNTYSKKYNENLSLEVGNYYAFQLWIIIGQIHYNSFICSSIAKKLIPNTLLVYTKDKAQSFMELRPDPDCIFADVLIKSDYIDRSKIKIIYLASKIKDHSYRARVIKIIPLRWLICIRNFRDWIRLQNYKASPYKLLIIGGGYDWYKVFRFKQFRDLFKMMVLPRLISKSLKGFPPNELRDILNNSVKESLDLNKLVKAIYSDLIFFERNFEKLQRKIKHYDALVTGVLSYPWDNFLAHIAAKMNMPIIVWQHGEKGQCVDVTMPYSELNYATDYFAYAPAVEKLYKNWIGTNHLEEVRVVGSIGKNIAQRNKVSIVYVTGKWFKTATPFIPSIDPDKRLFDAHMAILRYLDFIGLERKVVLKANNTLGFNTIPYEYKNITVDYTTPFASLLETADIVILDTPATTLIEACSTLVPIFVLGGRTEYFPEFLEKAGRRVVWCRTPDDLVEKLNIFIAGGDYGSNVLDNEYVSDYGANLKADEVVQRINQGLLDAIKRKNIKTA